MIGPGETFDQVLNVPHVIDCNKSMFSRSLIAVAISIVLDHENQIARTVFMLGPFDLPDVARQIGLHGARLCAID